MEFPLPHPDSAPRILARGADGNLWFSEHTGNRMARITQNGVITEWDIPTPNSQPRAIALGADGNIWFGMFAAGKVGRITPEGVITEFTPPTPNSGPRALAAGARRQHLVLRVQDRPDRPHHTQGRDHGVSPAAPEQRARRHHHGAGWRLVVRGIVRRHRWRAYRWQSRRTHHLRRQGQRVSDARRRALPPSTSRSDRTAICGTPAAPASGRVTPAGVVTEFPAGADARGVGLSGGQRPGAADATGQPAVVCRRRREPYQLSAVQRRPPRITKGKSMRTGMLMAAAATLRCWARPTPGTGGRRTRPRRAGRRRPPSS